ncbi:hypothetical protein F4810DRAFT_714029 [Camillea tinctor]|nr:hypothetical protein F4810DRAFT_714029 [Camillea tinctor]
MIMIEYLGRKASWRKNKEYSPARYVDKETRRCTGRSHNGWLNFVVPEKVLQAPPASQSSALVRLPPELILMILEHAGPLGRVSAVFACKQLFQVSSLTRFAIPSAQNHQCLIATTRCLAMRALLEFVGPRNANGLPSPTHGVCYHCCRWLPTDKDYWKDVGKESLSHPQQSRWWTPEQVSRAIELWIEQKYHQCPVCYYKREKLILWGGAS